MCDSRMALFLENVAYYNQSMVAQLMGIMLCCEFNTHLVTLIGKLAKSSVLLVNQRWFVLLEMRQLVISICPLVMFALAVLRLGALPP